MFEILKQKIQLSSQQKKETTLVGRPNAEIKQDIQLIGPGIALEHCVFTIRNNSVYITPVNSSK